MMAQSDLPAALLSLSLCFNFSLTLSLSIPLPHFVLKPDRSSLYLCSPLILSCRSQIPFGRTVDFSAPSNSKMIVVACNCIRHQWLSHWVLRVWGGELAERWKQSTHFTFATNARFDKHMRSDFVFICGKTDRFCALLLSYALWYSTVPSCSFCPALQWSRKTMSHHHWTAHCLDWQWRSSCRWLIWNSMSPNFP